MAQEGWHFKELGLPSNYTIESGEPRNDHYRMDFIIDRKNFQNYLQLFKDAGWEHLGEMRGWQYFRTNAKEKFVPEIYTNNDSKASKYQRLLIILIIFLPLMMRFVIQPIDQNRAQTDVYLTGKLIMSLLMNVYAMVMILRRIVQLKNK